MNIDLIMQDPKWLELSLKVMEMEQDIDEDYLVPFEPDEVDDDGNSIVKIRRGDYGKDISYVPVKHIRKRLDTAFRNRWSFFIIGERKETEPFDKWSKQDDEYISGDNYLRCIGLMVVPGLGIRMEYGVKKVFGSSEATDWKACKTDAFKKCAEAFGIYLNYSDEDLEDDEDSSSGSSKKGKKSKKQRKQELDDLEYSDEDLEDAFETEITFGKYEGSTLKEIAEDEEDMSYIEWLADNARDDDIKFFCQVLLKYYEEEENEKSKHRQKHLTGRQSSKKSKKPSGGSRKKSKDYDNPEDYDDDLPFDDEDEEEEEKPRKKKTNRHSSNNKNKTESERRKEYIAVIEDYLIDFDTKRRNSLLKSSSISSKYPRGKTDLNAFTTNELSMLVDTIREEEE